MLYQNKANSGKALTWPWWLCCVTHTYFSYSYIAYSKISARQLCKTFYKGYEITRLKIETLLLNSQCVTPMNHHPSAFTSFYCFTKFQLNGKCLELYQWALKIITSTSDRINTWLYAAMYICWMETFVAATKCF